MKPLTCFLSFSFSGWTPWEGGLKALTLDEYAPRRSRCPLAVQQVLFNYTEAM